LIDAFTSAARRAIASGAASIIPGQTIMAEILWQHGLRAIDDVPVIDALGVTIAMAEVLVRLRGAGD
jgi:Asp/Glu/hydantoin racemase